jgi:hypothetical protein
LEGQGIINNPMSILKAGAGSKYQQASTVREETGSQELSFKNHYCNYVKVAVEICKP